MSRTELFRPAPDPSSATDAAPAPPDDPRLLAALREYQAALDAGRTVDRAALLARYAGVADALVECLDGLDFVVNAAGSPAVDPPAAPDAITGAVPLGDYRIVREVGRGGMGVVYEAEQLSLRRRVALKVLPFAAALDPRQLQRFRAEAQAAACLHHTHIVPVYAVGSERGVHYYAMQFVDGQSLADLIRQLRRERSDAGQLPAAGSTTPPARQSTPHPGQDRDRFRTVAAWGVQAAEALEYAHSVGIVHRDIKPANLLLDSRGTLFVADFGLAYFMNDGGLTLTGAVLGTLRYMSPEQARGERSVDPRTDVYSLGVTLYELLTLRDAFSGADRQELLRKVTEEDPTPPRRVNPAVPAELDLIVRKAMAKAPAERYASAKELADDLGDWLAYRPIKARRPTLRQRAAKFARRHSAVVATAAVALALLAVTSTASGVLLWRANRELVLKKNKITNANQMAREVMDELTGKTIDDLLSRQGHVTDEQRALLGKVLGNYEQFAAESEGGPEARLAAAQAHLRVGQLRAKLRQPGAEDSLRRAVDLCQRLLEPNAESPEYRVLLARCWLELGNYLSLGRPDEALSAYMSAVFILSRLHEESPKEPRYQRELARVQTVQGALLQKSQQYAEAEAVLTDARRIHEDLAAANPNDTELRITWAGGLIDLNDVLLKLNRSSEAQSAVREALSLLAPLTATAEADPRAVDFHSRALAHWAFLSWWAGRVSEAQAALRQSQDLSYRLIASYPAVPEYRRMRAENVSTLGKRLDDMDRRQEAILLLQDAVTNYAQLVHDFPDESPFRFALAETQRVLGELCAAVGDRVGAVAAYRTAIQNLERMVAAKPNQPLVCNQLAWMLATCPVKPLRDPSRAVLLARRATQKAPGMYFYWDTLGAALYRVGEWKPAAEALHRSLELSHDQIPESMLFLAMTSARLGDRREAWNRYRQSLDWLSMCRRTDAELQRIAVEARDLLVATELRHLFAPLARRVADAVNDLRPWAARQFPIPVPHKCCDAD